MRKSLIAPSMLGFADRAAMAQGHQPVWLVAMLFLRRTPVTGLP